MALRTLRSSSKVVGQTADGDPIVEVRSVRLVLNGDADHFNRMLSCSKCRCEVPGPPVLAPADLDQPANAVICKDCVRVATSAAPSAIRPIVAPSRTSKAVSPVPGGSPSEGPVSEEDPRHAALERQISDLTKLLDEQRIHQGTSLDALTRKTQAGLRALATISDELGRKQEELARALDVAVVAPPMEVAGDPAGDLERRIEAAIERRLAPYEAELRAALAARVEAVQQAAEVEIARTRSDLARVAHGQDQLGEEFRQRTDSVVERLTEAATASAGRLQALEEHLRELQLNHEAEATDAIERQRAELRAALEFKVEQLSTALEVTQQAAALELARTRSDVARVAQNHDELGEDLRQRTETVGERLTEAATASSARLQALEEQLRELQSNVESAFQEQLSQIGDDLAAQLASRAEAVDGRTSAIEAQQAQLRSALESRVEELGTALEATQRPSEVETARMRADLGQVAQRQEEFGEDLRQRTDSVVQRTVRVEEQLGQVRDDLAAQLTAAAEAESERLRALELRVQQAVDGRTEGIEAQQAELRAALEAIQRASELEAAQMRSDLARVAEGDDALGEDLRQRTDSVAERLAETATASTARLEALEEQLRQLQANVEAEAARARSDSAAQELVRLEENLNQTRDDLGARLTRLAEAEVERLRALELRVQEVVDGRTGEIETHQVELRSALESKVEQLSSALEAVQRRLMQSHDDLMVDLRERMAETATASAGRLETLEEHLRHVEAEAPTRGDLMRIEEQLDQTRDDLALRLAGAAEAESERLRALELRVQEAVDGRRDDIEVERRAALASRVEELSTALERYAGEAGQAVARLSAENLDVRRSQEELISTVQRLQVALDAEAARAPQDAAALDRANVELARLGERLDGLVDRTAAAAEAEEERLEALEQRVEEVVEGRAHQIEAALRAQLERRADQTDAAVARASVDNEGLRRSQDELQQALAGVLEGVQQLQVTVDAESAAREAADRKGLRNDDLLHERLAVLAGAAEAEGRRLEAVEAVVEDWTERVEAGQRELRAALQRLDRRVEEVDRAPDTEPTDRMPEAMESLRRELRTALAEGLAEIQSSIGAPSAEETARIEALENTVAARDSDVSDLFDLQSALDAGMGHLRSDLAAARGATGVSSLAPLRSDVNALQEQIAAQSKALVALKKSVESLRRTTSGGATPAQKKAPRPAK